LQATTSRATAASFDAIEGYQSAEDVATGRQDPGMGGPLGMSPGVISKQLRDARAEGGDADARNAILAETTTSRERQIGILQQSIDSRAAFMERASTVGYSRATQEMLEAEGLGESMGELADDPMRIMAEVSIRSLPNMAEAVPLMVAGGLAAGPIGLALGAGAGASMTEYRASIADYMQQNGVDLTSAESMMSAAERPEFMAAAHEFAVTRAGIIGAASVVSGGLATKPLTPFVKNAVARELSNVVVQIGAQSVIEGAGEAGAQLATTGETLAER